MRFPIPYAWPYMETARRLGTRNVQDVARGSRIFKRRDGVALESKNHESRRNQRGLGHSASYDTMFGVGFHGFRAALSFSAFAEPASAWIRISA